jgi:hypothetical protein
LKPKCLTDSSILKTDATASTALAALAESISCILYVCVYRAIEMHLIWFRNPEYLVDFFSGVQWCTFALHCTPTVYIHMKPLIPRKCISIAKFQTNTQHMELQPLCPGPKSTGNTMEWITTKLTLFAWAISLSWNFWLSFKTLDCRVGLQEGLRTPGPKSAGNTMGRITSKLIVFA